MAIISVSAPSGSTSTSISRVRSGRSSGLGGSAVSISMMEEVKAEIRVSCIRVGWFGTFFFFLFLLYWNFGISSVFFCFDFLLFPSNKPSNTPSSSFRQIYRHPDYLNKHIWEHTRQWCEASKFVLSEHQ
jgi:hypothetical protein